MNKPNIVLIMGAGSPLRSSPLDIFALHLTRVLEPLSNKIYVIAGVFSDKFNEGINIIRIKYEPKREPMLLKIARQLLIQLKICFHLFKISRNVDIVIFFAGTMTYIMPVLWAKLLRKKVILSATGSQSRRSKILYAQTLFGLGGPILSFIFRILEKINLTLADQLAVESETLTSSLGLGKYKEKVSVMNALYVDTALFSTRKSITLRRNLIGLIGRLSLEKGVISFLQAIPKISKECDDIDFLIGGDGPLFEEIKSQLDDSDLRHKVKLTGWVSHDDELPNCLNELRLLVLPSFNTEGLPNMVKEAMACGAVVVATPVGGVPDLIKDGETGFIMENNSPECIAKNVIKALGHPNLSEIAKNARRLIEQEYSYEATVQKYRHALHDLIGSHKSQ